MVDWRQELWVRQSDMGPVKAVLTMQNESTTVLLSNVRVNQPVDSSLFLYNTGGRGKPRKVSNDGLFGPSLRDVGSTAPVERPLQEIRLEE